MKDRWSLVWEPLWFLWRRRGGRNGRLYGRYADKYFRCWWIGPLTLMHDIQIGD